MSRIFAGLMMLVVLVALVVPEVATAQAPSQTSRLLVTGSATIAMELKPVWCFTTVGSGWAAIWKSDSVVARTFKACSSSVSTNWTMTDSLHWGPLHRLRIDCMAPTGYTDVCSAYVTGVDSSGNARVDTVTFAATTAADTAKYSKVTWKKVRTVKFGLGGGLTTDTAAVYGYPIDCIIPTGSNADVRVAGVAYDSMVGKAVMSSTGVDGFGWLVVKGLWPTYVTAVELRPGSLLTTSSTSGSVYNGTAAAGAVVGRAAYASKTAGRFPIWVDCGN